MLASNDTLIIDRVRLRAPSHLQAEAQSQLQRLDIAPTASGEYLFIRHLPLRSSANQLGAQIQTQLETLRQQAVDASSAAAEEAAVVRFNSLGELLAQLSLDLLAGRRDLWFWQSWRQLFELPSSSALAELWQQQATTLPEMVTALASRNQLAQLWLNLSANQASALLSAIQKALSLPTDKSEQPADTPNRRPTLPHPALSIWRDITSQLKPTDPRLQLAALISLQQWRPDRLQHAEASNALSGAVQQLQFTIRPKIGSDQQPEATATHRLPASHVTSEPTPTAETKPPQPTSAAKQHQTSVVSATERSAEAQTRPPKTSQPHSAKTSKPATTDEAATSTVRQQQTANLGEATPVAQTASTSSAEMLQRSQQQEHNQTHAQQSRDGTDGIATDSQFHTQQGGLFYLLNVIAQQPILEQLYRSDAFEQLRGPWGCLYRLGDLLGRQREATLDRFIAYRMGLDDPVELQQLPPLPDSRVITTLAKHYYSDTIWSPQLLPIPAQVEQTSSHLDIHYPLQRVRLDVRRTGLDINPGWLPWLGQVVSFHYHADGESR